jgi:hypothetical protein
MSIKRSRNKGHGTARRFGDGGEVKSSFVKPAEPEKTWEADVAGQADERFVPYQLCERYEGGALILHGKFGKGLVVESSATQIVVLFSEGKKKLGHGIAPAPVGA